MDIRRLPGDPLSSQEEVALLNHKVGIAYLDDLLPNDAGNGTKARKFLYRSGQ